jgi:two-component system response regulator YesN
MYRLLIVDDEPAIAEGLAEMVLSASLPLRDVKFFFSAKSALSDFEIEAYDLVLADIRMPEMDGLAFVQALRARWPQAKVIFLTGFSDFDYAKRAIQLGASDYLLKPAEDEEVLDSLRRAIDQLEESFEWMMSVEEARRMSRDALPLLQAELFHSMLRGSGPHQHAAIAQAFGERRIPFSATIPVWTMIMRIDDFGGRFQAEDASLIQFAVQNMVHELWGGQFTTFGFQYEDRTVFLLQAAGSETDGSAERLRERMANAQDTIFRVLGVSLSLALAPDASEWAEWPEAFAYAETALRLCPYRSTLLVTPKREREIRYQTLQEMIKEVTTAVQQRDVRRFALGLDQAFGKEGVESAAHPEQQALHYIAIANQLSNLLLLYNLQNRLDRQTADRLGNVRAHKDLASMKQFLVDLFQHIVDRMSAVRSHPSDLLVEQVKAYIHEHLHGDLSLHALSKAKFVSPFYLSRLFHQVTGEPLTAYITGVKIEEAKKLLANDKYRVQDVAEKLGFQSANYFAKVFRKAVGISPQDYRTSALSP